MRHKVVVTHDIFDETRELLRPHCQLVLNDSGDTMNRRELLRRAADADAMMVFMPDSIDAAFLDACPRLKVVGAALKGYDNFDVEACTSRGVWFCNVPDHLTAPTAELTIALLLALARRIPMADRYVRSGAFQGWLPSFYGRGLEGETVGIIGMGMVGQAIARRLQGFDARVLYHDPNRLDAASECRLGLQYAGLDELAAESAYLIPMLPYTAQSHHLVNDRLIERMPDDAMLVNACRGSVVDERAVARALLENRLAGYAADVFEFEDWARADRPREIEPTLMALRERTLFTPHLGSAVVAARKRIEQEAARNILAALRGERPAQAVNDPRIEAMA